MLSPTAKRILLVVAAAAIAAVVLLWTKPWADSVMTVSATIAGEDAGKRTIYTARVPFSGDGGRPTITATLDLSRWQGTLVRVDLQGTVSSRRIEQGSTGSVACAAALVTPDGEQPVEFVGWPQESNPGLHVGPAGPRSLAVEVGNRRLAYAGKGNLWYVLRVPEKCRLRLHLRPVLATDLSSKPNPFPLSAPAARPLRRPLRRPHPPPDVFIYLIDALRADHLGCYGYDRPTSPAIDGFAQEATLYENAHTAATWTRPSVATILSGIYPNMHGAMHESDALADWPALLPEILHGTGYATYCITTNGNVIADLGFDQGYDEFIFLDQGTASWVNGMAENLLARRDRDRPVFMFLHTIEPHAPYLPSPEAFSRFDRGFEGRCDGSMEALEEVGILRPDLSDDDIAHLIDRYDAEISEADQGFQGFLDVLHGAGRYRDAFLILLADHGESFAEHDTMRHGWDLNQEDMRVPLIVHFPAGRLSGTRVSAPVSLIDIAPTVLEAVGLRPDLDYDLPGRSILEVAEEPGTPRRIFAEVSTWDSNDLDLAAVIDEDGYKRVLDLSVPPRENATDASLGLWDTHSDPKEADDASARRPIRADYGEQLIARWLARQLMHRRRVGAGPPPRTEIGEELRRKLRNLGYLGGEGGENGSADER